MVGYYEELRGIRKRLVRGKPMGTRMAVRAQNGYTADAGVKPAGDGTCRLIRWEQPVRVVQDGHRLTLAHKVFDSARSLAERHILRGTRLSRPSRPPVRTETSRDDHFASKKMLSAWPDTHKFIRGQMMLIGV